jgi:hypothetical protein
MEILKWLSKPFVLDIVIHDFREKAQITYINCCFYFKDGSILYLKEYSDSLHRKYSFHWQDRDGKLISRWDNAPQFQHLPSYPHHRHYGHENQVEASHDISVQEVLDLIDLHFS